MVTGKQPRPLLESHSSGGALSKEPDEITLPGWLNAAKSSSSYKRVVRIIELIRQNEQNRRDIVAKGAHIHCGNEKWPAEHVTMWRVADQVAKELQESLMRYTFNVRLTGFLLGTPWLLNMYCTPQRDDFRWGTFNSYRNEPEQTVRQSPKHEVCEGDAVLAALRLAERSLLSRVRLCERCAETWLFAKHKNYKFCGANCRQTYYTGTPEYRESKKRQMREYRDRLRAIYKDS